MDPSHPPDALRLRRAAPADVPAIAALAEEAYAVYVPRMGGRRPVPMDADYGHLVETADVWVAEVHEELVGSLVLVPERDHMLLESIAVRPAWQGRAVGRRLLELTEERARAAGLTVVRLYTHVLMVENQRLYERIGYVETGRRTEDGRTRVFYEKHLPG